MQAKFVLGLVTIKEEAALALTLSGQDAEFFLTKHASGEWPQEDFTRNEQALREGEMIMSHYRTLKGFELIVMTTSERDRTFLFCPLGIPIKHEPLPDMAHWYKPKD